MEWKNIFRGFLMGISDLVPGVSGGTIAFILGIYNRLLEAISGSFSREWKQYVGFLLPLGVGIVLALLLLSRLIEFLLEFYYEPTQFFFIGLIIGVLPFIIRQANTWGKFKFPQFFMILVGTILVASMAFINTDHSAEPISSLTAMTAVGLFFSGWLASMAMLLPGISGSLVLLIIGVYPTAIHALSTLNIPFVALIGSGVVIGFIVSSKGIRYLLANYPQMTFAAIIGLIIGSIFVVFPGIVTDVLIITQCVITFILGLSVASLLGSINKGG